MSDSGPHDWLECGTNRGFLSSAIMKDLYWDKTGRRFYLLDTFGGLAERYVSVEEKKGGALERNRRELDSGFYTTNVEAVRTNFAEWKNGCIIVSAQFPKLWSKLTPGALSPYRHELLASRSRGDTPPLGSPNAGGACVAR